MEDNNIEGYSLFNDIENFELRARNRAIIMANILEDNFYKNRVSRKGLMIVKKYLKCLPILEQDAATSYLTQVLKERGFDS